MVASLLTVLTTGIQDDRMYDSASANAVTLYPFAKVWRHTGRFTTRWERIEFDAVPAFGQTATARLIRKGQLIMRVYLVSTLPDIYTAQRRAQLALGGTSMAYPRFGWTNSLGHALARQVTLDIANERVETLDSSLLEILDEFHTPLEKVPAVNRLIKRADTGFTEQTFGWPPTAASAATGYQEQVVVPLPFWFARGDPGCALPIDAIGQDTVRVGITFRGLEGLYYTTTPFSAEDTTTDTDGAGLWPLASSPFYAQDPVAVPNQTPLSDANGVIRMPATTGAGALSLGETYLMAEYVYLDQPEANRFRLADLQVPVVQHFKAGADIDTKGLLNVRIPIETPHPTRALFFSCQPTGATALNAHFLVTRGLTGSANTLPVTATGAKVWWPDAVWSDLPVRPAFALSDAEPVAGYALEYQGSLVRYRTDGPALFRSVIPSYEYRKTPWVNRYLYVLPFGVQNGFTPPSVPQGAANFDKIVRKDLVLQFRAPYGAVSLNVGRFTVRCYTEAYNLLRVYGGRAGLMF